MHAILPARKLTRQCISKAATTIRIVIKKKQKQKVKRRAIDVTNLKIALAFFLSFFFFPTFLFCLQYFHDIRDFT